MADIRNSRIHRLLFGLRLQAGTTKTRRGPNLFGGVQVSVGGSAAAMAARHGTMAGANPAPGGTVKWLSLDNRAGAAMGCRFCVLHTVCRRFELPEKPRYAERIC